MAIEKSSPMKSVQRRMKMKTAVRSSLLLIIITTLLLAGCAAPATEAPAPTKAPAATDAPAPTEPPPPPEEKVEVTMLSMGADWLLTSLWDSTTGEETPLMKAFEDKHGIDVVFVALPEDAARQKMMLDLSSHTAQYDIVTTGVWALATYAAAGYLEPLDDWMANQADLDYFSIDDYVPASMIGASYEGKVYALPLYTYGPALIYNKAMFEEYDVEVPTNVEELEEAAEKLTVDTDGDGKIDVYGISMRARRGEEPTGDITGFTWAYGASWFEGNAYTADQIRANKAHPTVNSPEFIAGYEEYAKLLQNWGPPESANWGWVETMDAFAQGKVAMHLIASSAYWYTRVTASIDPEDIGVAPVPVGPGGKPIMNFFDISLSINADSEVKEAAWLVLQFLSSYEVQKAQAEAAITSVPRVSLLLGDELKAFYPEADLQVLLDALKLADPTFMPKIPEYVELCDILGTAASEVVAGTKTAEEALNDAQAQIDQIMTDAGYYD
jgi:ABC-type glycerol-3-phosphate transport system substrate-binding protein